jgi:excisionase family DNA binding protein
MDRPRYKNTVSMEAETVHGPIRTSGQADVARSRSVGTLSSWRAHPARPVLTASMGRPRRSRGPQPLATKPFLSVSEVAVLFGTHRATLYRSIERGDFPLPVVVLNGRRRVPRVAVERLLHGESQPEVDAVAAEDGGAAPASRSRPMCSAARRSSSPIASV